MPPSRRSHLTSSPSAFVPSHPTSPQVHLNNQRNTSGTPRGQRRERATAARRGWRARCVGAGQASASHTRPSIVRRTRAVAGGKSRCRNSHLPQSPFPRCASRLPGAEDHKVGIPTCTSSTNFLVFQNEVEKVAQKAPKELTELIERISGSEVSPVVLGLVPSCRLFRAPCSAEKTDVSHYRFDLPLRDA